MVAISASMVVFWQILASYFWGSAVLGVDRVINEWVVSIRQPFWNEVMTLVTVAGNGWTIFLGSLLVGVFLKMSGRNKCFWALVASNLIGVMFVNLSKLAIGRIRPPVENAVISANGYALPSGHSYFGMIFYGLLVYFLMKHFSNFSKRLIVFLTGFGFVALLAISRIYLGVHWASDVVAGLAMSTVWLSLTIAYLEYRGAWQYKKIKGKRIEGDFWLFGAIWFLVVVGQFIAVR